MSKKRKEGMKEWMKRQREWVKELKKEAPELIAKAYKPDFAEAVHFSHNALPSISYTASSFSYFQTPYKYYHLKEVLSAVLSEVVPPLCHYLFYPC